MLNANLEQYKILRSRETPAIEVHLLENYQGMSATDAYGIAEPSNSATAPAIANAVYNARAARRRSCHTHAFSRLGRCRGQFRQPADSPGGDDWRESAATPALLVFPLARSPLRPQGRRGLLRIRRGESISRHFRPQRLRDGASLDLGDRIGCARCQA